MTSQTFATPVKLKLRDYKWQIHLTCNTVSIQFGKHTTRTLLKKFPTNAQARSWATAAVSQKKKAGYTSLDTNLPFTPRRSSRKRSPVVKLHPHWSSKRHKTASNLAPLPPPAGVVDPPSALDGDIYSLYHASQLVVYDVMLVDLDPTKLHDSFHILQLIRNLDQNSLHQYVVYQRHGSTGTLGTINSTIYDHTQLQHAIDLFERTFHKKTGLAWSDRDNNPIPGMFRIVKLDAIEKRRQFKSTTASYYPRWQYWVDDFVDAKPTAWYDYKPYANTIVEQLYAESRFNPWLLCRIVKSGHFSYEVNWVSMMQKNVTHPNQTIRSIRRVAPGQKPDSKPPLVLRNQNIVVSPVQTTIATKSRKKNVSPVRSKASKNLKIPPALVPKIQKAHVEIPVDSEMNNSDAFAVVSDFDVTLNHSDITGGSNNNKYYKLQLLQGGDQDQFYVWMRWGRVGESRGTQTMLEGPFEELEDAEKLFGTKFWNKTRNYWSCRGQFETVLGKYEILQMDYSAKQDGNAKPLIMPLKHASDVQYLAPTLPRETKELVELLFEKDVYTDAMKAFDIDVNKMPLGNISKSQISKGVAILEQIEDVLNAPSVQSDELAILSSLFYTRLPHDFGRRRPPIISDQDMLQNSYNMCNVLLDMETANKLMEKAEVKKTDGRSKKILAHPTDAQYASLNADLHLVQRGSEEHRMITEAFQRTKGQFLKSELLEVWRVERKGELERFNKLKLPNRRLLWHGSHIGAISAILSTGLRIMPHSGGRVGRGIYLASENGKSLQYTTPASNKDVACMFLAEAALGKSCKIYEDDCSLKKAPAGFDSVLACGRQTPGFKLLTVDGESVLIPVEDPKPNNRASQSCFHQDEFLVYSEAQVRIRYVVTVKKRFC